MELLTVAETTRLLKVNPITIRRYIASGKLAAVKVGKGVRVRKEAIDQLLTPVEPATAKPGRRPAVPRGKPFTREDALWNIVGMFESDGPGDVARSHDRYLAEAYADKHDAPRAR